MGMMVTSLCMVMMPWVILSTSWRPSPQTPLCRSGSLVPEQRLVRMVCIAVDLLPMHATAMVTA